MNHRERIHALQELNGIIILQSSNQQFKKIVSKHINVDCSSDEVVTYSQSYTLHNYKEKSLICTSGHLVYQQYLCNQDRSNKINQNDINNLSKQIQFNILKKKENKKDDEYIPLQIEQIKFREEAIALQLGLNKSLVCILVLSPKIKFNTSQTQTYYQQQLQQTQQLMTISSPFGILSSHLYENCVRSASIAKCFSSLYLIDTITNIGQEGGGVYDSQLRFIGMLLPRVQIGNHNNQYYSFVIGWSQGTYTTSKLIKSSCIVYSDKYASGTLIANDRGQKNNVTNLDVFVLTVNHFLNSSDQQIRVRIDTQYFEAKVLQQNKSNLDFCFLQLINLKKDESKVIHQNAIQIKEILNKLKQKDLGSGDIVQTVGYGLLNESVLESPLIAKGRISKVVMNEAMDSIALLQTDAYVHNGYSGGGVFHNEQLIGFQSFNIKINPTIICDMNFVYPISILQCILTDLLQGTQLSNESKLIFSQKDDFYTKLHQLQTRYEIPNLLPKL